MQTSAQYSFASLTAAQDITYVTQQAKPALAAYLAAGGLKPLVVEASLGGACWLRMSGSDCVSPCVNARSLRLWSLIVNGWLQCRRTAPNPAKSNRHRVAHVSL